MQGISSQFQEKQYDKVVELNDNKKISELVTRKVAEHFSNYSSTKEAYNLLLETRDVYLYPQKHSLSYDNCMTALKFIQLDPTILIVEPQENVHQETGLKVHCWEKKFYPDREGARDVFEKEIFTILKTQFRSKWEENNPINILTITTTAFNALQEYTNKLAENSFSFKSYKLPEDQHERMRLMLQMKRGINQGSSCTIL